MLVDHPFVAARQLHDLTEKQVRNLVPEPPVHVFRKRRRVEERLARIHF